MKIAAQLYTLRDYLKTPADIAETFHKVRAIGYEAVQFSGAPIGDAKELKKMADDAGIEIVCTHIPFENMKNDLRQVIEDHHAIGASYAGVGAMPDEYRNSAEGFLRFAQEFDAVAKELKKEGLGATYHNHWFEFERFNGTLGMDILRENSDTFQFLIDAYWVQFGGGSPAAWIKNLAGRVDVVHYKDMNMSGGKPVMAEVMEGNLDWPSIFGACEEAKVKCAAVEQDDCGGRDPFGCLKTSYDNLQKWFAAK